MRGCMRWNGMGAAHIAHGTVATDSVSRDADAMMGSPPSFLDIEREVAR